MFTEALAILSIPKLYLPIEGRILHKKKSLRYSFTNNISADVVDYIRTCEQCQKQGDLKSPKAVILEILKHRLQKLYIFGTNFEGKKFWKEEKRLLNNI